MSKLTVVTQISTVVIAIIAVFGRIISEWIRKPRVILQLPNNLNEYSGEKVSADKSNSSAMYHLLVASEKKWYQKFIHTESVKKCSVKVCNVYKLFENEYPQKTPCFEVKRNFVWGGDFYNNISTSFQNEETIDFASFSWSSTQSFFPLNYTVLKKIQDV